jgi:manganese transport protein
MFTSRRDIMGELVNMKITTFVASVVALLILALNFFLLFQIFTGG